MDYNTKWDQYQTDDNVKILTDDFKAKSQQLQSLPKFNSGSIEFNGSIVSIQGARLGLSEKIKEIALRINERIEWLESKKKTSVPAVKVVEHNYQDVLVFVSHASKDKKIVEHFVREILLLGFGLDHKQIFYSSAHGMDIKTGDDFREAIKDAIKTAKVTFLIVTPNYKNSEVCMNEMGAAWVLGEMVYPLVIEPITYKSVGAIMEPKQIEKLLDRTTLNKLHSQICKKLKLTAKDTVVWVKQVEDFIAKAEAELKAEPFPQPIGKDEFDKISAELVDARSTISKVVNDYSKLQQMYDEVSTKKDKTEVEEIEKKYQDTTAYDEFMSLNKEASLELDSLPAVVSSLILCDFFNQPYSPDDKTYGADIKEASRRGIIYFDGEQYNVKDNNPKVKSIRQALQVVSDKIEELYEASNAGNQKALDFFKKYESEFSSEEIDCTLQDYWEEHFDFKLKPEA